MKKNLLKSKPKSLHWKEKLAYTFFADVDLGFHIIMEETFRVLDIDTPEIFKETGFCDRNGIVIYLRIPNCGKPSWEAFTLMFFVCCLLLPIRLNFVLGLRYSFAGVGRFYLLFAGYLLYSVKILNSKMQYSL